MKANLTSITNVSSNSNPQPPTSAHLTTIYNVSSNSNPRPPSEPLPPREVGTTAHPQTIKPAFNIMSLLTVANAPILLPTSFPRSPIKTVAITLHKLCPFAQPFRLHNPKSASSLIQIPTLRHQPPTDIVPQLLSTCNSPPPNYRPLVPITLPQLFIASPSPGLHLFHRPNDASTNAGPFSNVFEY